HAAHEIDLSRQLARLPDIVAVKERDQVAGRLLDTRIPRRRRSQICRMPDEAHPLPAGLEGSNQIVARPLVHDEYFMNRVVLIQHALNCRAHAVAAVVDWDNHTDASRIHTHIIATDQPALGAWNSPPVVEPAARLRDRREMIIASLQYVNSPLRRPSI